MSRGNDAIPTWSGFNYQGKVMLLYILKLINQISKEEDGRVYSVNLEEIEDFCILRDFEYISFHQVKAWLSVTKWSSYSTAMDKLLKHRNGSSNPMAKCYLMVARDVADWDEDSNTYNASIELYKHDSKIVGVCDVKDLIIEEIKKFLEEKGYDENQVEIIYGELCLFLDDRIALMHKQIQYKDYEQVYLARMQPEDGPGQIRRRFNKKLPRAFHGHSISVSDVLVLNKGGVVAAYYVEKEGFTVIAGFIRPGSSAAPVSFGISGFHIEGKEGSWHALDSIIVDGREFFLMEHEAYGKDTEWVVVDEAGRLAVEGVYHGFDQSVQQQIKDYLNPLKPAKETVRHEITLPSGKASVPSGADAAEGGDREKPPFENWQKYMENGEYVRSVESREEENHSLIDGNKNNGKKSMAGNLS